MSECKRRMYFAGVECVLRASLNTGRGCVFKSLSECRSRMCFKSLSECRCRIDGANVLWKSLCSPHKVQSSQKLSEADGRVCIYAVFLTDTWDHHQKGSNDTKIRPCIELFMRSEVNIGELRIAVVWCCLPHQASHNTHIPQRHGPKDLILLLP